MASTTTRRTTPYLRIKSTLFVEPTSEAAKTKSDYESFLLTEPNDSRVFQYKESRGKQKNNAPLVK